MIKKYIVLTCMMVSAFYSTLGLPAIKKTLRFEIYNYMDQTLPYIMQNALLGQLYLPTHINKAPGDGSPTIAEGLIGSDNRIKQAVGSFKIGIDENNYCEFDYNIEESIPIKPIRSTGQMANHCQIDPDTHRHIIINRQ